MSINTCSEWSRKDDSDFQSHSFGNFHENHYSIQDDHNLRLHNLDLPVGEIVTAFVENGRVVSEAHTCEECLEDYFKRVTGGEGVA